MRVMSLNPALMSNPPASAENLPASAAISAMTPASAEFSSNLPASAVIPASTAIPTIVAPPMTSISVSERVPHLGAEPTRAQDTKVISVLSLKNSPFKAIDCVKVENRQDTATILSLRFPTDPSRHDDCRIYKELDTAVSDDSFPKQHIMGFKVNLNIDVQFPSEQKKINKKLVWRCVGLDGPVDGKWELERC
jgi:hypothetical protein